MLCILKRILIQIKNDKRSLGLLLIAPLLVLTLLYFILGDSDYTPHIAVYSMDKAYVEQLEEKASITKLTKLPKENSYLEENKVDAIAWKDSKGIHITLERKNTKSAKALKVIQNTNEKLAPMKISPVIHYLYETNDENQLDSLSYVFLGVLSFFFVFLLSGMSFVRERFSQTLERMLMTPISRFEVIGGYTLGYGIISAVQSVLIILFTVYVLGIHVEGSVFLCILVMILMSFLAVSMGALFSIFSNNELQMVQFIPIVIIPQIFYSGLIPIDTIPLGLGNLKYIIPIYYTSTALDKVMIEGKGLMDITPFLTGLVIFIIVLFGINVLSLKKYRRL
ncbi:ABC transporter permease [Anaeromicropila herbilytica]|uniref:Transport permease protein n=1 Tax=Anaeromicropila herbilytica TaxID=2785025 RepID=A0A7R7EK64_9FIRM|nr:ABC transporter permease [Anaeromicropila herbilytica]BCN30200.1 transport permease protein [Anaeromicropila herbilytica]